MIDIEDALREHGTRWSATAPPAPDLHAAVVAATTERRRRRIWPAVAASVVAVAVVAAIPVLTSRDHTEPAATLPAEVSNELVSAALQSAAANGDAHPESIQVVRTTHAAVLRLEEGYDNGPDAPVWYVQVRGHFTCASCKLAPTLHGAPRNIHDTALQFEVAIDSSATQLLSGGSPEPEDLSSLGTVIDLPVDRVAPPAQLVEALRRITGLTHAEVVRTTVASLRALVDFVVPELRPSTPVWFVQAHGSFAEVPLGPGPIGNRVSMPPASYRSSGTAPLEDFVYPIVAPGQVGTPDGAVGGLRQYDLSRLGTVVTVRP